MPEDELVYKARTANTLDPCPECSAGKCSNCIGETWDPAADDTAPCPCAAATPHEVAR